MLVNVVFLATRLASTSARLTDSQGVPTNSFSTKADWAAPTTSTSAVLNDIGYTGYLRQGSVYQVCANITDSGNPASGISTATTNVAVASNVLTTSSTAVTLTSGSYTCNGVSYNRRTANLTANASITEGSKTFQATTADVAGNSETTNWTVALDNTRPTISSFTTTNVGGGTDGKIDTGDTLAITLSETPVDLTRIITGWDGSSLSTSFAMKVFQKDGAFSNNDGLALCYGGTGAGCKADGTGANNVLARVNLASDAYVSADVVFDATIAWNSSTRVFTVTVGSCTANCTKITTGASTTGTLTPRAGSSAGGLRDQAGNNTLATDTATRVDTHF